MKIDKRAELGERILKLTKQATPTGQEEGNFSEGGALVNQEIYPEILVPNFAEGSLYSDCKIINVGADKNGIKIPVTDLTTIDSTTVRGGFRAYVVGEGNTKTISSGKLAQLDLKLNKMAVVIPCTDELLQDSTAIASYMSDSAGEALMALADDSIVNGSGLMTGIAGCACTGFVSLTDPLTLAELHNMFDMYYGGKKGKWYMSKVRFGQILDLYEANIVAGGGSIHLTSSNGIYYVFGYPIQVVDTMVDNQIMLADLSQYVIAQKEMTRAVNTSLLWLEDEQYFRFVIRMNGKALWVRPVTLADGSVVYPFVMASGFEESSSSESSSSYIKNWSSSSDSDSTGSSISSGSLSSMSNSSDSLSSESLSSQSAKSESSASDSSNP